MSAAAVRIIRPGLLTTVQDLGRWGHQASGVPVAGPMDWYSHRLANQLVANREPAAALEVTLVGPEIQAMAHVVCAVAGAEFELTAGDRAVPCGQPFELATGAPLRFGRRIAGARATLAIRGGIDLPPFLGSRATSVSTATGSIGRPLAAGDLLPIGADVTALGREPAPIARTAGRPLRLPRGGARLRTIAGPQADYFTAAATELFFAATFVITPSSNRMGYRLDGPPLQHADDSELLSEATPPGSVQVPASGHPILLMADRQTTGGYPKIATVITADIPLAAQLAPGDWVRFVPCSLREALDALRREERRLVGQPS